MRFLIELCIIAVVIAIGWRQPYRDPLNALMPGAGIGQSRLADLREQRAEATRHAESAAQQPAPGVLRRSIVNPDSLHR